MIVYRAIQGFIGGGMIPSVFAVAFTIFPASKRGIVSPMIGLVATLAPTIGPTVGGYLSNAFSWHWLFLVNVVPGILVTIAVFMLVDFDKPDHALLKRFDFVGLAAMALFLGSLEYVLEEGPRYDWLDDRTIATFAALTAVGGVVFFWRAFTAGAADRRSARLQGPQLRLRLGLQLRDGHRPLWPDLSLSRLSRARCAATTR